MKEIIIKPNNLEIDLSYDFSKHKTTALEAIEKIVRLDDEQIQCIKLESDANNLLNCDIHPFVQAAHFAFSEHLPLIITPDIIWYMISSAAAAHVNQNSEKLRNQFVEHNGKETIVVRRDDFILDSLKNPWHEAIDEFSIEIGKLTKNDVDDLFQANFTTTTKESRVVSQIVLMDALKSYFNYRLLTRCGIPEIRVRGEKEDWEKVKNKTKKLIELIPDLNKWYDNGLSEVINHFLKVFDQKIDVNFWNQLYKRKDRSGGSYISGWILALFPYLFKGEKNQYVWEETWQKSLTSFAGITTKSFNYHMNQVPFIWDYFEQEIKMLFRGGLISLRLGEDHSLMPVFGYLITRIKKDKGNNNSEKRKTNEASDESTSVFKKKFNPKGLTSQHTYFDSN